MSSAIGPMNPMGTPYEKGSPTESFPITSSTTQPFFPPVCLQSHWDPTKIYKRSVPDTLVPLPIDFRPYTKVCLEYRTTAPEQRAPNISDDMVFPQGGEVYPPDRYLRAVDKESLLRRLDRPLGTCDDKQYEPPETSDMYVDRLLVPTSRKPPSRFVEEISMPSALIRVGAYNCREEADQKNWSRSTRLFNNATKQDRYHGPTQPQRQYRYHGPTEAPRQDRYQGPSEPPRQDIWSDSRRCKPSQPTQEKTEPNGCRAWGC